MSTTSAESALLLSASPDLSDDSVYRNELTNGVKAQAGNTHDNHPDH